MKKLIPNSHVRKAFQGRSRGFILIEVLIAIALLGIIVITFMSALSTSSKVLSIADERTVAESLARRQMEYVKNQGYIPASALNNYNPTYQEISGIPDGYSIWSVDGTGVVIEDIVGIPWDSEGNLPLNWPVVDEDVGLQKISLVIKHQDEAGQDKVIYTFINDNAYWAPGKEITLEGYKVDR